MEKKDTISTPKMNPPIWAHQAMPLPPPPFTGNKPEYSCEKNQNRRKTKAGISTSVKIKKIGTRLAMRELGNRIRYAPRTPANAPLAPIIGTALDGNT